MQMVNFKLLTFQQVLILLRHPIYIAGGNWCACYFRFKHTCRSFSFYINYEGDVVQVTAEKPLIQVDETSSVNVVTGDQLENMPIRTLDGVLATMPGVVVQNGDVHIRGGRDNEVAYYLNGASTTNLGNRENLVYVPQEAVEELQVQVGGYDAEVSGANSGVVKRSLKTGTDTFSGSFSLQTDGSGAGESALLGDGYSYGHQTVLASVSGPIMPGLKFFAALEQSKEEDPYVKVANAFNFSGQMDEQPANASYIDMFDLSWQDGYTPGVMMNSPISLVRLPMMLVLYEQLWDGKQ